ncbi:hypothetical protein SAMN05216359_12130 [Roseateles sp. YR242]|uniref:polyketide cyclase n=1 Tax=Roseateles sp. YR242 TaxID=1855305 RepID=UPI0008B5897D|nr:polyketide cyclase [Roseateles sp. YR242]SEL87768.1 hypothetical protein SAMN05216359_12130 [Roseateles sp. YR242]
MTSYPAEVVTESINVPARQVYDFARTMENLTLWASGLASGIRQENGEWFTDSPMGRVRVAMAPPNDFGVLDHDVTLPHGPTVHNAFRVSPSGSGCVLTFVVLRLPGVTDEAFKNDVAHVTRDLKTLKALLERAPAT